MNDFDFEELDKAVNKLADKTHDEHGGPDSATQPKSVSVPATPESEPKPVEPVQVPAAASSSTSPTEPRQVIPVKHRLNDARPKGRGAFMDIVPPALRKAPTRVGVSVQPVSKLEEIVPEEPSKEHSKPAPEPGPQSMVEPEDAARAQPKPTESSAHVGGKSGDVAWPDPLDFGGRSTDEQAKEPQSEPPKEKDEPEMQPEPTSPFLAEAKVEKRPLGAFSNFKPVDEPKPEEPDPLLSNEELTPELDGTLREPEPEKAPLPPKEGAKIEEEKPAQPDVHAAAMMAIPDQYHPEPKVTDKTPRPVYDTKEYHPPLLEATSHEHRGGGSVWGKLFIALVVLALLAVAGYFVYIYFFTQV